MKWKCNENYCALKWKLVKLKNKTETKVQNRSIPGLNNHNNIGLTFLLIKMYVNYIYEGNNQDCGNFNCKTIEWKENLIIDTTNMKRNKFSFNIFHETWFEF